MEREYKHLFKTVENQNWLKASLAVSITRDGMARFVNEVISEFQASSLFDIIQSNKLTPETMCNTCKTENVVECPTHGVCVRKHNVCTFHNHVQLQRKKCPSNICNDLKRKISNEHRYGAPSWKNTNATGWCSEPWEIAKCFMPPDGYDNVPDSSQTDFNGIISVIINCKRFDVHFDNDLKRRENVCTKARDCCKFIRHLPTLEVTDQQLSSTLDVFLDVLNDTNHLRVNKAIKETASKLEQLKLDSLAITNRDIVKVIESAHKQLDEMSQTVKDDINKSKEMALDDMKALLQRNEEIGKQIEATNDTIQTERIALIQTIEEGTSRTESAVRKAEDDINALTTAVCKGIHTLVKSQNATICQAADEKLNEIRQCERRMLAENRKLKTGSQEYENLKKDLQSGLIGFYSERYHTISISPVVEENDAPLEDIYVAPNMIAKNDEQLKDTISGTGCTYSCEQITKFSHIFPKNRNTNTSCQNIYIASPAGMGKSSLCRMLAQAWRHAIKMGDEPIYENTCYMGSAYFSDIWTMRRFTFTFLLTLRYAKDIECDIIQMIKRQIVSELANGHRFTDNFLHTFLQEETCLVILDGFDEWSHSVTNCGKPFDIPHRKKGLTNCTFLTTSRPWKIDQARISKSEIDFKIELVGLSKDSIHLLSTRVVNYLNDEYNKTLKVADFEKIINKEMVHYLTESPITLMQLICLWYEGNSLGISQCGIYGNVIEMILQRQNVTLLKEPQRVNNATSTETKLQNTFQTNTLFCKNFGILSALATLAFETLFGSKGESKIVFGRSEADWYVSEQDINRSLKLGIITQNSLVQLGSRSSAVSFIHKTYHEYFAAMYISLLSNDDCSYIHRIHMQLDRGEMEDIFDFSNVFTFLCGMNPDKAKLLSLTFMHFLSEHINTIPFNPLFIIDKMQSLIISGLMEGHKNGHTNMSLHLHHIDVNKLQVEQFGKNLLKENKSSIASVVATGDKNCVLEHMFVNVNETYSMPESLEFVYIENMSMPLRLFECFSLQLHKSNLNVKGLFVNCLLYDGRIDTTKRTDVPSLKITYSISNISSTINISNCSTILLPFISTFLSVNDKCETLFIKYTDIKDTHIPLPSSLRKIHLTEVSMNSDCFQTLVKHAHTELELKACTVKQTHSEKGNQHLQISLLKNRLEIRKCVCFNEEMLMLVNTMFLTLGWCEDIIIEESDFTSTPSVIDFPVSTRNVSFIHVKMNTDTLKNFIATLNPSSMTVNWSLNNCTINYVSDEYSEMASYVLSIDNHSHCAHISQCESDVYCALWDIKRLLDQCTKHHIESSHILCFERIWHPKSLKCITFTEVQMGVNLFQQLYTLVHNLDTVFTECKVVRDTHYEVSMGKPYLIISMSKSRILAYGIQNDTHFPTYMIEIMQNQVSCEDLRLEYIDLSDTVLRLSANLKRLTFTNVSMEFRAFKDLYNYLIRGNIQWTLVTCTVKRQQHDTYQAFSIVKQTEACSVSLSSDGSKATFSNCFGDLLPYIMALLKSTDCLGEFCLERSNMHSKYLELFGYVGTLAFEHVKMKVHEFQNILWDKHRTSTVTTLKDCEVISEKEYGYVSFSISMGMEFLHFKNCSLVLETLGWLDNDLISPGNEYMNAEMVPLSQSCFTLENCIMSTRDFERLSILKNVAGERIAISLICCTLRGDVEESGYGTHDVLVSIQKQGQEVSLANCNLLNPIYLRHLLTKPDCFGTPGLSDMHRQCVCKTLNLTKVGVNSCIQIPYSVNKLSCENVSMTAEGFNNILSHYFNRNTFTWIKDSKVRWNAKQVMLIHEMHNHKKNISISQFVNPILKRIWQRMNYYDDFNHVTIADANITHIPDLYKGILESLVFENTDIDYNALRTIKQYQHRSSFAVKRKFTNCHISSIYHNQDMKRTFTCSFEMGNPRSNAEIWCSSYVHTFIWDVIQSIDICNSLKIFDAQINDVPSTTRMPTVVNRLTLYNSTLTISAFVEIQKLLMSERRTRHGLNFENCKIAATEFMSEMCISAEGNAVERICYISNCEHCFLKQFLEDDELCKDFFHSFTSIEFRSTDFGDIAPHIPPSIESVLLDDVSMSSNTYRRIKRFVANQRHNTKWILKRFSVY